MTEVNLKIDENEISILRLDPIRIATISIKIKNNNYKFYKKGKFGINLDNLSEVLRCNSSDNSKSNLIFGEDKVFIEIKSLKHKSTITRSLDKLDIQSSERIKIELLDSIDYPCYFELNKGKLKYLIQNFGIYGGVIKIRCSKNQISFIEEIETGRNEIIWNQDSDLDFVFNLNELKKKFNNTKFISSDNNGVNIEKVRDNLKNELNVYQNNLYCEGYYSFDFFKINNIIGKILSNSEKIRFYLRNNYPLKSSFDFPKLGTSSIVIYISPRN